MKSSLFFLLVIIALAFSACTPKIVKNLAVLDLEISKVEINSDSLIDSLFIKHISFSDTTTYIYDKKNHKLEIPKLIVKNCVFFKRCNK